MAEKRGTPGGRKASGDGSSDAGTATVRSFPDRGTDGDGLTQRQRRVLEVIRDSVERRGYPPSMREIGEAVGLTSSSSVAHQLKVLEEKGFLKRDPNRPRAIEVFLPEVMAARRSISSVDETAYDETGVGDAAPLRGPRECWALTSTSSRACGESLEALAISPSS